MFIRGNKHLFCIGKPEVKGAAKEASDKSWKAFRDDPEWKKVVAESEKDGKLLAKPPESVYMNPTDYSPLK
jgi:hypothetical protein